MKDGCRWWSFLWNVKKIRVAAKTINNDIGLLGEIWYDSISFLNGDQFDSSMNYPFRNNLLDFLVDKKINLEDMLKRQLRINIDIHLK